MNNYFPNDYRKFFHCKTCGEGFTVERALDRHTEWRHGYTLRTISPPPTEAEIDVAITSLLEMLHD